MIGVLRTIHGWAGAILSLLLLVLGLTGTLLVFEDDWLRLTVPEARAQVLPRAAELGVVAERLEAEHGDLRTVNFAGSGVGIQRLYLNDHRYGYADESGRTLVAWHGAARPEALVFDLHHELMAGETGELVGGIAALAAVLLVLTGLVVWAPGWRASRLRIWPRSGRRGDMVSSHRNLGLITALPVLLFCLTGAGLVFHDQARALLAPGAPPAPDGPPVGRGDIDWPVALAAAQQRFPTATLRMAGWPSAPGKPASIRLKQRGEWHPNGRTTVLIDPATSRVVQVIDAQRLQPGLRATNALYPIHAASIGGWPYRILTALSGLALAALGGIGTWSFLIKPRRRRPVSRPGTA